MPDEKQMCTVCALTPAQAYHARLAQWLCSPCAQLLQVDGDTMMWVAQCPTPDANG
jgi:hypothetical protein